MHDLARRRADRGDQATSSQTPVFELHPAMLGAHDAICLGFRAVSALPMGYEIFSALIVCDRDISMLFYGFRSKFHTALLTGVHTMPFEGAGGIGIVLMQV